MDFFRDLLIKIRVSHSHFQASWAGIVTRHQRQGHQQLILNEARQIKLSTGHQHIFFGLIILRLGQGLGFDKSEPAVNCKRLLDRAQAALAGQWQAGGQGQVQPGLTGASLVCT